MDDVHTFCQGLLETQPNFLHCVFIPTGLKALQFHLQPEGVGLLHGGDSLGGAVLRLGAGARENRGAGRGESRDGRTQIPEAGGVALL